MLGWYEQVAGWSNVCPVNTSGSKCISGNAQSLRIQQSTNLGWAINSAPLVEFAEFWWLRVMLVMQSSGPTLPTTAWRSFFSLASMSEDCRPIAPFSGARRASGEIFSTWAVADSCKHSRWESCCSSKESSWAAAKKQCPVVHHVVQFTLILQCGTSSWRKKNQRKQSNMPIAELHRMLQSFHVTLQNSTEWNSVSSSHP